MISSQDVFTKRAATTKEDWPVTVRKMRGSTNNLERSEASTMRRHDGQELQASDTHPCPPRYKKARSPWIGRRANAKGTPAIKGERGSAPTHLPDKEVVVETVQDEAEATRTSADDRTGAVATRIAAVTGLSARRDVIPGGTGMRTCTWPMAGGSNQLWRAMWRLHLPRSQLGLYFHDRGRNRD